MPIDAGMELLGEVGAVDHGGRITVLGRWLLARLVAEVPPPLTPDLSAEELLGRLAVLPEDEVRRQPGRWLADRDPEKAADELLAAAAACRRLRGPSLYRAKTRSAALTWCFGDRVSLLGGTR